MRPLLCDIRNSIRADADEARSMEIILRGKINLERFGVLVSAKKGVVTVQREAYIL